MVKETPAGSWATTEEVCEAAGVSSDTAHRWAKMGVLPAPTIVYGRGRHSRWPLHAPEQARWVDAQLRAGLTLEEIRSAIAAGEFKPSADGD